MKMVREDIRRKKNMEGNKLGREDLNLMTSSLYQEKIMKETRDR